MARGKWPLAVRRTLTCFAIFIFICQGVLFYWHANLTETGESSSNTPIANLASQPRLIAPVQSKRNKNKNAISSGENPSKNATIDPHRPLLILHVGPPKTATTTLQNFLSHYRTLLRQDNYDFVGTFPGENMDHNPFLSGVGRSCGRSVHRAIMHGKKPMDVACWARMKKELAKSRQTGVNIILSEENLSVDTYSLRPIFELLVQEQEWSVKIVVAYRRFHEWIISAKNQAERPSSRQLRRNRWTQQSGLPTLPHYPYIEEVINGSRQMPMWYTDNVVRRYEEAGFDSNDVVVWNLHANDYSNIVESFFCDVLTGAVKTCAESQRLRAKDIPRANPSMPLEYDMLAVAAAEQGLVNLTFVRANVAIVAQVQQEHFLGKTARDFAMKCLPRHELEPLLQTAIQYESELLPEFHSSKLGRVALKASFELAVQDKKYCSVDTETVLQDPAWQAFFQNLKFE
jgi:hypothetical protein